MSVTVTGVNEVRSNLQRYSQLESAVLIPSMRDWAESARLAMIKRQHFRSGRMRSMTKINKMGKYWAVIIDVPYARKENERAGKKRGRKGGGQGTEHRFVEPAMREIHASQLQNLLNRVRQYLNAH